VHDVLALINYSLRDVRAGDWRIKFVRRYWSGDVEGLSSALTPSEGASGSFCAEGEEYR
jgi:hypothetical protein